ncbi:MAG: MarR family winged helix-turn-helix transcriptional regulator [Eubacteriaceae bacterium]
MSTNGQQLFEAFSKIKKSTFFHFQKGILKNLKPHEFFMLTAIADSYDEVLKSAQSMNISPPPGVNISEISRFTCISMSGVSQTISNLVKHGYVDRITTEKDRRLVYVNITTKGRTLKNSISKKAFIFYEKAAEILDPEDSKTLVNLLEKLVDSFSQIEKEKLQEGRII